MARHRFSEVPSVETEDVDDLFIDRLFIDELFELPIRPICRWYAPLKCVCEYVLAVVLFLLSSPILLLGALLVKATSKGPTFYLQYCVGKNGRPFRIIKFRTIEDTSESKTGAPDWSTHKNDSRITPVRSFLRLSHFDELPQLLNVLKGDMALVGPRPERFEVVQELEWKIPSYAERFKVRPGITGLSQLKLPPDNDLETIRRRQIFDLYYIVQMNPWLDARIIISSAYRFVLGLYHAFFLRAYPKTPNPMAEILEIQAFATKPRGFRIGSKRATRTLFDGVDAPDPPQFISRSSPLWGTPNFFMGIAQLFDFGDTLSVHHFDCEVESDQEAFESDWAVIGNDFQECVRQSIVRDGISSTVIDYFVDDLENQIPRDEVTNTTE